jgi:cytochrome c553
MIYRRPLALVALLVLSSAAFAQTPYVEGDAEAGANKAAACMACHGADGNSGNPQWPNIAGQHASYVFEQLQLFKSGERQNPIMMSQAANLSEQDMKDLAVYFAGQTMQIGAASEELAELGEQIYRGGIPSKNVPACAACHGPAGQGNPGAGYPRLSGQNAVYTANTLIAYRNGDRGEYPGGAVMQNVAANMSDEEIQAVASFVSGLYVED